MKAKPTKAKPPATRKPDRIPIAGGGACPRCSTPMQRFRRPAGYKPPNETPFHSVLVWDRCSCGYILRLEEPTD
jgi:hypothetical protein